MGRNDGYIKAKIKSQGQIAQVYPSAVYWGKPIDNEHWCHGADEIILPFLRKTIFLKKKRRGLFEFYYKIKDIDDMFIVPNWIAYFDSEHLVPPAEWSDSYNPSIVDDIWLNYEEDRIIFIDDLLIITG